MSKTITISLGLAKFFKWLLVVLYALFTVLIFCVLVKPELTENYVLEVSSSAELFNISKCDDCTDSGLSVHVNRLGLGMLFWIFIKMTAALGLMFMITGEVISILKNFKNLGTFYEGNIRSFRRIGIWALLLAGLYAFRYLTYSSEDGTVVFDRLMLNIPFDLIALSLGGFVLAEVFKEGKLLQEDKESIL